MLMPLTKVAFKVLFIIGVDTGTHKTHRKPSKHSTCPLLGRNWAFISSHRDSFKNLWLTRTLHHPVLSELGVSAPTGWLNATPESCKKTKPSFTTGMRQLILPASEWLAGHSSRLLFFQMGFMQVTHKNTDAFKRFPNSCCHSWSQRPN